MRSVSEVGAGSASGKDSCARTSAKGAVTRMVNKMIRQKVVNIVQTTIQTAPEVPNGFESNGSGEDAQNVFLDFAQFALRTFDFADFLLELMQQRRFLKAIADDQPQILIVPGFLNVLI